MWCNRPTRQDEVCEDPWKCSKMTVVCVKELVDSPLYPQSLRYACLCTCCWSVLTVSHLRLTRTCCVSFFNYVVNKSPSKQPIFVLTRVALTHTLLWMCFVAFWPRRHFELLFISQKIRRCWIKCVHVEDFWLFDVIALINCRTVFRELFWLKPRNKGVGR